MTIAVAIKVVDGIVLAADSATTLSRPTPAGHMDVTNIYNHANKVANLHKGSPVGFMTWGIGGFDDRNLATIAKDFRAEVWPAKLGGGYTVKQVAEEFLEFLRPLAEPEIQALTDPADRGFGFLIAGHSPSQHLGEGWVVETDLASGTLSDPQEVLKDRAGLNWWGQPQWIQRLVLGVDVDAYIDVLVNELGVTSGEVVPGVEVWGDPPVR